MRRSSKDYVFLQLPADQKPTVGVCLGYDFVSEHEHGISDIHTAFGIAGIPKRREGNDFVGADVYTISKVPEGLKLFDIGGYTYLIYSPRFEYDPSNVPSSKKALNDMLRLHSSDKEALLASWSDRDFGIRVSKSSDRNGQSRILRDIYEAMLIGDVMIYLGGRSSPFANNGLLIAIRSRMPEEALVSIKAAHVARLDMQDTVLRVEQETGLREKLEAAGKRFMALSPKLKNGGSEAKTKYPIVYWLNPWYQDKDNYGWFTVEDLFKWIENEGPIPKKQKRPGAAR
jgi:hypothetical protein